MKKTLTFLSLMTAMATSAVAGTVAIAPAPAIVPAAPVSAWEYAAGVEFAGALADQSMNPNLWGARLTMNLYKPATDKVTHEVNFGLGYLNGSESIMEADVEVTQIPITVGYNAHYSLTDKLSVFAGAKLGLNVFKGDVEVGAWSNDDTDWGWQWSIGTGITYNLNGKADLVLAYDFTRVYADLAHTSADLGYHIISLGLRFPF